MKKNFSAGKTIPPCGQTGSSQTGIHAHLLGSGKFFPGLATTSSTPSRPDHEFPLRSRCAGLRRLCHIITAQDHEPAGKGGLPAWNKRRGLQKGGLLLSPQRLHLSCHPS